MSILYQMFPFNHPFVRRLLGANWKQGDEEDTWRDKAIDVLFRKLKKEPDDQYTKLRDALDSRCESTDCVTLTKSQDGRIQVCHRKMYPHLISCRVFRWPDLQQQAELKTVHACYTSNRDKVCINPYHYSRVDRNPSIFPPVVTPRNQMEISNASPMPPGSPESYFSTNSSFMPSTSLTHQSPPPNYQENQMDSMYYMSVQQQPFNISPHVNYQQFSPLSESKWYYGTNGLTSHANSPPTFESQTPPPGYQQQQTHMDTTEDNIITDSTEHWCRITYAELTQKVGEPFKSSSSKIIVDGFTNPSVHNRRFSLGVLSNINRNSSIEETRRAIRKGICLENNNNQIYVLNMSESSIFFHSKNCNVENELDQHAVVKIEPQVRKKIFDQRIFDDLVDQAIRQKDDGLTFQGLFSLIEHCIIKMSFVKGWGSIYQRQDVTATPCWIEIHLLKPYALIDQYLREIKPPMLQITSTS